MKVQFMSLGSGSSGNCYYLGTEDEGILVDAGIGIRTIRKTLKERAIRMEKIRAIFITHDHADHIKSAGQLAHNFNIPVYTTAKIHEGMRRSYCMMVKPDIDHTLFIEKECPKQVGAFEVTCFEVPHDGTDNVGYCIRIGDKTFSFLTDIGHITETAARYIAQANYLILEANYDEAMLWTGPYPRHLKERISSPTGHLCNTDNAQFIASHFPKGLKYLWLCHLSKDNNRPELALKAVETALAEQGIVNGRDVSVIPLQRTIPSELYCFE